MGESTLIRQFLFSTLFSSFGVISVVSEPPDRGDRSRGVALILATQLLWSGPHRATIWVQHNSTDGQRSTKTPPRRSCMRANTL